MMEINKNTAFRYNHIHNRKSPLFFLASELLAVVESNGGREKQFLKKKNQNQFILLSITYYFMARPFLTVRFA